MMTTPSTPFTASPNTRGARTLAVLFAVLALLMTACGASAIGAAPGTTDVSVQPDLSVQSADPVQPVDNASELRPVVVEPAASVGDDPFVESVPHLCDVEGIVSVLAANPERAAGWAEVQGIAVADIERFIRRDLTEGTLMVDTRVTNHGFRNGVAYPIPATLEAGTAVLIDELGMPRVRCACGNPLLAPAPTPDELNTGDLDTAEPDTADLNTGDLNTGEAEPNQPSDDASRPETSTDPTSEDFCTIYDQVWPTLRGGPTSADAIDDYITFAADAFERLTAAAHDTAGFPADLLADLQDYTQLLQVAEVEGPSALGDTALRDRLMHSIPSYCKDRADDNAGPALEAGDSIGCGSMAFTLLVFTADELGIDHAATSTPFFDMLEAIANGASEAELGELADSLGTLVTALEIEEVGCAGAEAMAALIQSHGYPTPPMH